MVNNGIRNRLCSQGIFPASGSVAGMMLAAPFLQVPALPTPSFRAVVVLRHGPCWGHGGAVPGPGVRVLVAPGGCSPAGRQELRCPAASSDLGPGSGPCTPLCVFASFLITSLLTQFQIWHFSYRSNSILPFSDQISLQLVNTALAPPSLWQRGPAPHRSSGTPGRRARPDGQRAAGAPGHGAARWPGHS